MSLNLIEHGAYDDYEVFATKGTQFSGQDPKQGGKILTRASGSIEGLHGTYHIMVGGWNDEAIDSKKKTGHMSSVPVAAFDPVFWMHHWYVFPRFYQV